MPSLRQQTISVRTLLFTFFAIGFLTTELRGSTLWGDLKAGPHSVGYSTIFTHDLSRPAITLDAEGRRIAPTTRGRQMQVGIWYPASITRGRSPMRFEEYVYLTAQEVVFSGLSIKQQEQSIQNYMKEPLARGANIDKLQALMRMRTGAFKDAPPAAGRFAIIVYAHIAPSANSVMCEYLASHGFVVAAVPWKGTFEYNLDVGLTGVETQVKDIEFVISLLKAKQNVDADKVGLIGMSFGAISVLGLQTRNSDIDALISLDGGIGSAFGASVVQRTPYYSLSRITSPLLHLYGTNVPGTDLSYLNTLKYSERYLIGFPEMRHADFVNQGMFEHLVPRFNGEAKGDTKTGFEWSCRYSLYFLNAYLKGDQESLASLHNGPDRTGVPNSVLTIDRKSRLQPPPTVRHLQEMITANGIQSVVSFYMELKKTESQPLPQQTLSDIARWLGEKNDWKSAEEIVKLRLDSYPTSAWANYAAAEVYRRLDNRQRAAQLYREALRLLPTDFDAEIDFTRRRGIYEGATRILEAMKD